MPRGNGRAVHLDAVPCCAYLQADAAFGGQGRGSCFDNAAAESFSASLKAEIGTRVWSTRERARRAVFAYLGYYNRHRLHSTPKHRTPYEIRAHYRQPFPVVGGGLVYPRPPTSVVGHIDACPHRVRYPTAWAAETGIY
jgi:Integrase core domain